jgi:hypothetical protein
MKWLAKRLSERSSQVALGSAIAAGVGVGVGAVTPDQLVAALLPLVAVFLAPDKAVAG